MSRSVERVEVFSAIQRRRRYSVDQKLAVLAEAAQPGMSISYVARRHGISPSLVFGWRRRMSEGGKEAPGRTMRWSPLRRFGLSRETDPGARACTREEDPGERDPARGIEAGTGKKTDLALAAVTHRGCAVRRVAEVLKVSRSQLSERLKSGSKPRIRYRKSEDGELLDLQPAACPVR
jgi:transposase-like protein